MCCSHAAGSRAAGSRGGCERKGRGEEKEAADRGKEEGPTREMHNQVTEGGYTSHALYGMFPVTLKVHNVFLKVTFPPW